MANELECTTDVSARLDRLLSRYLESSRVGMRPIACPPWRNRGRQLMAPDHASFTKVDGGAWDSPACSAVENARPQ
jgi:hypothetical protein